MATIPIPFPTTSPSISTRTRFFLPKTAPIPPRVATWRQSAAGPLRAVKQQQQTAPVTSKRKKRKTGAGRGFRHVDGEDDRDDDDVDDADVAAAPMPKPPAGFVVDPYGKVLMASSRRIVTIVDPESNLPLECIIRRIFRSSQRDECMLLCPVDMPVLILKSTNFAGWSTVDDEEVKTLLPSAAYALAKIHMHLVISGFCYTARGGFCYSEEDIIEFKSDTDDIDLDGMASEGVEVTCFNVDGAHYMIYTPCDPLLFVAVKDKNGILQIADDDLLDDQAVVRAVDEETEFNALVEEESALLESVFGER